MASDATEVAPEVREWRRPFLLLAWRKKGGCLTTLGTSSTGS
jgi:hypothetical protein